MRIKKGIIVSKKMAKTLVVRVDIYKKHSKYDKRYRSSKKFYVHTEQPENYEEGQIIEIAETKPMSKLKRWKVFKLLNKEEVKTQDEIIKENNDVSKNNKEEV